MHRIVYLTETVDDYRRDNTPKMKLIPSIISLLLCLNSVQGQSITGRVIDSETKAAIKEARIKKGDTVLTTNFLGYFQVSSQAGDTLQISHPDYGEKFIIVPDQSSFAIGMEKLIVEDDKIYRGDEVDEKPEPENGMNNFWEQLIKNWDKKGYPAEAKRNGVQGVVSIFFVVDEKGDVVDSGVLGGPGYGCDETALEVFRSVKVKWSPGIKDGKPVKVIMVLPFSFRLG